MMVPCTEGCKTDVSAVFPYRMLDEGSKDFLRFSNTPISGEDRRSVKVRTPTSKPSTVSLHHSANTTRTQWLPTTTRLLPLRYRMIWVTSRSVSTSSKRQAHLPEIKYSLSAVHQSQKNNAGTVRFDSYSLGLVASSPIKQAWKCLSILTYLWRLFSECLPCHVPNIPVSSLKHFFLGASVFLWIACPAVRL